MTESDPTAVHITARRTMKVPVSDSHDLGLNNENIIMNESKVNYKIVFLHTANVPHES